QLPTPVQETIRAHVDESRVEDIDRGILPTRTVYEVAFKENGRHTELRVAEDGTVVDRIVEGRSVLDKRATQVATAPDEAEYGAGFEQYLADTRKVTWDQLPARVQQIVQERSHGAEIQDIEQGRSHDGPAYQIAYKKNGKHVELRTTEDGSRVKEVADGQEIYWARDTQFSALPPNIQRIVTARVGSGDIQRVQHGVNNNVPYYRVNFLRHGEARELRMSQDGSSVREMAASQILTEPAGAESANP
ncbi:MAG: hypothetical protein ACK4UN_11655, partial [Limisphaerales bacterium]